MREARSLHASVRYQLISTWANGICIAMGSNMAQRAMCTTKKSLNKTRISRGHPRPAHNNPIMRTRAVNRDIVAKQIFRHEPVLRRRAAEQPVHFRCR